MYETACKTIHQHIKSHLLTRNWPNKALIILLVVVGLLGINTIPARAGSQTIDLPISIIDGISPPQLQGEDQQNPAVVALPDKNKWLVVWEDWRNWTSTGTDIYGRFIDGSGNYCGSEFIICGQPGNQTVPTLAYRPGSTILAAWQDARGAADNGFIYYKTIDVTALGADGSGYVLSDEIPLSYTSIDGDNLISRQRPGAAYDAARNLFWLVWVESRNALQRINENAFGVSAASANISWRFGDTNYIGYATIGGSNPADNNPDILRNFSGNSSVRRITHTTTATEDKYEYEYFTNVNNVTVACDALAAETLIVWEGRRGKATLTCTFDEHEHEVTKQIGEDAEGNPIYETVTEVQIEGPSYDDTFHSTLELGTWAGDSEGKVHIYSLFDKNIPQTVVQAQQIDGSGISAHYPSTAFEPVSRKFLVAWEAQQENGFSKIYGQLLFSGGGSYGPNQLLSYLDANGDGTPDSVMETVNQTLPNVSVDISNQMFLVTWQDARNAQVSAENLDIYGQFVNGEGSLQGNNYAINTAGANQFGAKTAYNQGNHQFLSVWKDARNANSSNSDIYGQKFDLEDLQVYNNGQVATQIILTDEGSNASTYPLNLGFPTIQANSSISKKVTIKNTATSPMKVDAVSTSTKEFSFTGLAVGEEIAAGKSLTFSVTFSPTTLGNFSDTLALTFISGTEGNITINSPIKLSGKATGTFILREADSFTADRNYPFQVNAFTNQAGHLYVLMIHDPLSAGTVYALTPAGNLVPFPYTSTDAWQGLYYSLASSPSRVVDLRGINLQQLGCGLCPGPLAVNPGGDGFMFGPIGITPPDTTPYSCADDFKYMTGDFYVATYIADGTAGMPFNFNQGLLELLWLKIHSLNGNWQVASEYYGQNRVHSALLQVQENNGAITAQWGSYHPQISYSLTESAYIITFALGGYQYTYTINQLTADRFSGFYHCEANGSVIVDRAPVSGLRVQ